MFLPEHYIPAPTEKPMVMPQGVDSTGQTLEIKLWKATPNHGTITHLEAEGDQGSIRYDDTAGSRMHQALAQAGMRSVFQAVGIDAQSYPTPDRPTITTYTTEFPTPLVYIERANRLVRPNGPQGADRLTFVPIHGSYDPANRVQHLANRKMLIDVESSHDVDFHGGAELPLTNSAELMAEVFPRTEWLWQSYQQAVGVEREEIYKQLVEFAHTFDLCFRTPNFADLAVNPSSTEVEAAFRGFFSWKAPEEIPRLITAARLAIANFEQPTTKPWSLKRLAGVVGQIAGRVLNT